MIVSGGGDRALRFWNVETSREIRSVENAHGKLIKSLAFSPDGKIVATGSGDAAICLWDTESGRLGATLRGHVNTVYSVAFSPDGHLLASGCFDNTVRLWNVQTGAPVSQR